VLTSRAFDFAVDATDLPENVLHVGPQLPTAITLDRVGRGRPLLLVSFSTTYQAQEDVLAQIVLALSSLPVDALVTTGPAITLDQPPSANVEVSRWADHADVLPRCALVITHGGLGTVMAALAHGVPMICMPMGRDQDGNAARVTRLGAGLELTHDASSTKIADTVRTALADTSLYEGARRIAAAIRDDVASDLAVHELEALAATTTTTERSSHV